MKMSKGRTYTEAEVRERLELDHRFFEVWHKLDARIMSWGEYDRGVRHGLLAGALLPLTLLAWLAYHLWERWHK